jgi:hypothetical protein
MHMPSVIFECIPVILLLIINQDLLSMSLQFPKISDVTLKNKF